MDKGIWRCDGNNDTCTVVGTAQEVDEHILAEAKHPDGSSKSVDDITHWGRNFVSHGEGCPFEGQPYSMLEHDNDKCTCIEDLCP